MIALLKYLKGYLRIKVWGFSPERFMNLCSSREILLWDIIRDGDAYYMNISLKGFYQLKSITKKTGTRVVICKRYGLPFLIPTLMRRRVFILGLFLAVSFWIWSSGYIWDIELEGNYYITQDAFDAFLDTQEVKIGMRKGRLDIGQLEKDIRKEFTQVTWTSAKLSGTRLKISIKENDAPIVPAEREEEQGQDLVSEYDGVIVSIIVRKGVPKVKAGENLEKGAVLVEGSVPVYQEDGTVREYHYVNADADIVLEHTRSFSATLPCDYIQKEYTGRTSRRYFLRLGDEEWKMPENRPFLVYDSVIKINRPLFLEKLSVPLFWGCYTYREYMNVEYKYTVGQAQDILNKKINAFIATLEEKGVQIIEKNVKIDTDNKVWTIKGELLVQEFVGKRVDIVKTDIGDIKTDE